MWVMRQKRNPGKGVLGGGKTCSRQVWDKKWRLEVEVRGRVDQLRGCRGEGELLSSAAGSWEDMIQCAFRGDLWLSCEEDGSLEGCPGVQSGRGGVIPVSIVPWGRARVSPEPRHLRGFLRTGCEQVSPHPSPHQGCDLYCLSEGVSHLVFFDPVQQGEEGGLSLCRQGAGPQTGSCTLEGSFWMKREQPSEGL